MKTFKQQYQKPGVVQVQWERAIAGKIIQVVYISELECTTLLQVRPQWACSHLCLQ